MDIFEGNKKLEAAIFQALDYALYTRHAIGEPFIPVLMLYTGEEIQRIRLAGRGDPNDLFEEKLRNSVESYDYIVWCCEGKVPHGGTKQDAVLVKGFDTSLPQGFLFAQRFQGIETGGRFKKLGNPALLSKTEPLPVPLVSRADEEEFEEPFISGMVIKDPDGRVSRVVIAGHYSASVLSPLLFDAVIGTLREAEPNFSGQYTFNFVPDTLQDNPLNQFILQQLFQDLQDHATVQQWESRSKRKLQITLEFNPGKGPIALARSTGGTASSGPSGDGKAKPWWKFW